MSTNVLQKGWFLMAEVLKMVQNTFLHSKDRFESMLLFTWGRTNGASVSLQGRLDAVYQTARGHVFTVHNSSA
jgi:hypothetical protein